MSERMKGARIGEPESGILSPTVRGILWREWLVYGRVFLAIWGLWLLGGWYLPILIHPLLIMGLTGLCALLAGTLLGGADVLDGAEEFSLALPPTRSQRYVARCSLGALSISFLAAVGLLTVALDLPQAIWRLFVNSGFTEAFPGSGKIFLYPLAVFLRHGKVNMELLTGESGPGGDDE